jgi:hypothetical protein
VRVRVRVVRVVRVRVVRVRVRVRVGMRVRVRVGVRVRVRVGVRVRVRVGMRVRVRMGVGVRVRVGVGVRLRVKVRVRVRVRVGVGVRVGGWVRVVGLRRCAPNPSRPAPHRLYLARAPTLTLTLTLTRFAPLHDRAAWEDIITRRARRFLRPPPPPASAPLPLPHHPPPSVTLCSLDPLPTLGQVRDRRRHREEVHVRPHGGAARALLHALPGCRCAQGGPHRLVHLGGDCGVRVPRDGGGARHRAACIQP